MTQQNVMDELQEALDSCSFTFDQIAQSEPLPVNRRLSRVAAVLFAVLAIAYHADNALADDVIRGSTSDENGHVSVHWEYDLAQGQAVIVIINNDVLIDSHERLRLQGLIPQGNEFYEFNWPTLTILPCSGATAPFAVFGRLNPMEATVLRYQFPADTAGRVLVVGEADINVVYSFTSAWCDPSTVYPIGVLRNFVRVERLSNFCEVGDYDADGDVDLHDFAEFQANFTGPVQ